MANRRVSKEEFNAFIDAYPNPLERDVVGMCEPPVLQFNDFSGGKGWPDSVVASIVLTEHYPKDGAEPYRWSPNTLYIKE